MSRISKTISALVVVSLMLLIPFYATAKPKAKADKEFVVVLDAGHGGSDIGAPGSITNEKDVNLAVALALGEKIKSQIPGVKVVYTRDKDIFIPLNKRCEIANNAGGNLFISIHNDSSDKNRESVAGSSVYAFGLSRSPENLAVAQRENTVTVLENGQPHTMSYDPNSAESQIMFELNQKKHLDKSLKFANIVDKELVRTAGRKSRGVRQANFQVLVYTSMPSVLVELDFICNPNQEMFLASKEGQNLLAQALCNSLKGYITETTSTQATINNSTPTVTATTPASESTPASGDIIYKVQILTSNRILPAASPEFKGLTPVEYYKEGNLYKYVYGAATTMSEARLLLKEAQAYFTDAFIIKMRAGERIK